MTESEVLARKCEDSNVIPRLCPPHLTLPGCQLFSKSIRFGICAVISNDKPSFSNPALLSFSICWPSLNSPHTLSDLERLPSKPFVPTVQNLNTPVNIPVFSQVATGPVGIWAQFLVTVLCLPISALRAISKATTSDTGWQPFLNSTQILYTRTLF